MESVKKQEPFQLTLSKKKKSSEDEKIIAGIKTNKFLYVMILPSPYFLILGIFLWGLVIAFQDYQPF